MHLLGPAASEWLCAFVQAGEEARALMDVSTSSIVEAEAAYLRQQLRQIPALEQDQQLAAACHQCRPA